MPRPRSMLVLLASLIAGLAVPGTAASAPALRGVSVDVLWDEASADTHADIDDAVALGANMIRVTVSWQALEPAAGAPLAAWYLDRLDDAVGYAGARNVKVLLTPIFTPCWASSAPGAPARCDDPARPVAEAAAHPPADPATYARFVAVLAARYRTALAGIELWNEPNLSSFWTSPTPAADYARLVRAAAPAIKRAAPAMPVIVGALSGVDVAFYRQLRALGLGGGYDAFSVHPYNDGRAPDTLIDPQFAHGSFLQGLLGLRAAMRAARDTHPVWLTELGWNTSSQRGRIWLDGVSTALQAAYLTRALTLLGTRGSGVDYPAAVNLYRLRDIGADPADPQHNYGLETQDRTRKPAFAAVRQRFGWHRTLRRRRAAARRRSTAAPRGRAQIRAWGAPTPRAGA